MNPNDTTIYALIILDKYENRPDDLDDLDLANFVDVTLEAKVLENFTLPVLGFCETLF